MARKPNYSFERNKRAKAKAAKREAKRQAKQVARAQKAGTVPPGSDGDSPTQPEGTEVGPDNRTAGVIPPASS